MISRSRCGNKRLKAGLGISIHSSLQREVAQESRNMIPDCQRKLVAAHAELTQLLVSY